MRKSAVFLCAVFLLSLCASSAMAVPVTFFGERLNWGGNDIPPAGVIPSGDPLAARIEFESYLTDVGTEDFEGFVLNDGKSAPLALHFPGTNGVITATIDSWENGFVIDYNGGGRFATSGTNSFNWDPDPNASPFTIVFSEAISVFGFYGTDIGDYSSGQLKLTLEGDNIAAPLTLTVPNTSPHYNGALFFYGFHDLTETYNKITFGNTSWLDGFGIDDLIVGDLGHLNSSPVPEPATILLLGSGLIGLAGFRRRSKRS